MFSLIYAWTNAWVNNRDAGDLSLHRTHYDVTVMGSVRTSPCRVQIELESLAENAFDTQYVSFKLVAV